MRQIIEHQPFTDENNFRVGHGAREKERTTMSEEQELSPNEEKNIHDSGNNEDDDDDVDESSDEESSSDDDGFGLEGVIVRHPDASSDDSDDDSDNEEEPPDDKGIHHTESEREKVPKRDQGNKGTPEIEATKATALVTNKRKDNNNNSSPSSRQLTKKKRKTLKSNEPETIQVEFIFCDMDEKYFHGLKALLHNSGTIYHTHSSALADLMIENISVGTVITTPDDDKEGNDATIWGFASVLNVTTYQESPGIQFLKETCLKDCPADRRTELQVVLSGQTKRPAGFLLHGRMINLPLEIVYELQQQLVLDMDWAVEHAEGGEEERKSLDFGAFIRLAPCQAEGGSVVYRFFDDEIFAGRAEFVYTVDAPKSYSKEVKQLLNIMVMTKTGHREAMRDLAKLVGK